MRSGEGLGMVVAWARILMHCTFVASPGLTQACHMTKASNSMCKNILSRDLSKESRFATEPKKDTIK